MSTRDPLDRELDLVSIIAEDRPLPPVPYALRHPADDDSGLLVEGDVTILSGEGKLGKSTFYMALALSLTGIFVMLRELYFAAGWAWNISPATGLMIAFYPMPLAIVLHDHKLVYFR